MKSFAFLIILLPWLLFAQSIEFDGTVDAGPPDGNWMFDSLDETPYHHDENCEHLFCGFTVWNCGNYCYHNIFWNPDGDGNGSGCNPQIQGSGHESNGICTNETTDLLNGIENVTLEFDDFKLSLVEKRNFGEPFDPPNGLSGDHRIYSGGIGIIRVDGEIKLKAVNCKIELDVDWPAPTGPGDDVQGVGWGVIDVDNSDPDWVTEFDNGNGQVDFDFSSFSPVIQDYWAAYDFSVTVRSSEVQQNVMIHPIEFVGEHVLDGSGIILNVHSFTGGGFNNDMFEFFSNQVMADAGGGAPDGIETITADCFWELGTVLEQIDADVTFSLEDISGINDPDQLRILHRETSESPWQIYPDFTLIDANHIRANHVTDFSEWTIGSTGDNPLPAFLSTFGASYTNNQLEIYWITNSETNNLGWKILRGESVNAYTHGNIHQINSELIPGAGTTTSPTEYRFIDNSDIVSGKKYWYWLISIDFGLNEHISSPTSIYIYDEESNIPPSIDIIGLKQNYPNPFNPNTNISFLLDEESYGILSVINSKGEKVSELFKGDIPACEEIIVFWDGTDFSGKKVTSGLYYYKLSTKNKNYVRKMLLLK